MVYVRALDGHVNELASAKAHVLLTIMVQICVLLCVRLLMSACISRAKPFILPRKFITLACRDAEGLGDNPVGVR